MSYERMLVERAQVDQKIKEVEEKLRLMPEGHLLCASNRQYMKWYWRNGVERIYIPKENRFLAEQLAEKKYYQLLLNDLFHEKEAIDLYLKHCNIYPKQAEELLVNTSEYQKLLSHKHKILEEDLANWQSESYDFNKKHPEQLIQKAISGNLVRSKSEVLIDMILCKYQIPFRYECALKLGQMTVYPDFTMRHPKNGKVYYWEHFGIMDDPSYSQKAYAKMQLYTVNGIIPSITLITTFETKDYPMSPEVVEGLVKQYFIDN